MKTLTVPCFNDKQQLEHYLNQSVNNQIDQEPWPAVMHTTTAAFSIAHNQQYLFIQYQVQEQEIRALQTSINSPVYEDSCVEFFLQLAGDSAYYNFEFNCIGTPLAGYGTGRENREALQPALIAQISRTSTINSSIQLPAIQWSLRVEIPVTVFQKHQLRTFSGLSCKANFYKCGDELPRPHYLAWNNIRANQPDFHLPEYFGQLKFNPI